MTLLLGVETTKLPGSVDEGDADAVFVGVAASDALGTPVSGALDLEGDGLGDLALGVDAGEALGTAVAGLGDTDGEGWDDLAVGAPGYDTSSTSDAGALFLFARWY